MVEYEEASLELLELLRVKMDDRAARVAEEEKVKKQKLEEEKARAIAKQKADEEEKARKQKADEEEKAKQRKLEEEKTKTIAKQKTDEEEKARKQKADEEEKAKQRKLEEEKAKAIAKQKADEEEKARKQKAAEEEKAKQQKIEEEKAKAMAKRKAQARWEAEKIAKQKLMDFQLQAQAQAELRCYQAIFDEKIATNRLEPVVSATLREIASHTALPLDIRSSLLFFVSQMQAVETANQYIDADKEGNRKKLVYLMAEFLKQARSVCASNQLFKEYIGKKIAEATQQIKDLDSELEQDYAKTLN